MWLSPHLIPHTQLSRYLCISPISHWRQQEGVRALAAPPACFIRGWNRYLPIRFLHNRGVFEGSHSVWAGRQSLGPAVSVVLSFMKPHRPLGQRTFKVQKSGSRVQEVFHCVNPGGSRRIRNKRRASPHRANWRSPHQLGGRGSRGGAVSNPELV